LVKLVCEPHVRTNWFALFNYTLVQQHFMLGDFNNTIVGVVPTVVANYRSYNCVC
jgi:hypothetical protein